MSTSKQYYPYRWPHTILDPTIVYGSDYLKDKNFVNSRKVIAYKDAVSKFTYDQKTRESVFYIYLPTCVMRATETWAVQTKYLNTYTFQNKTFYAAVLHITMTGNDIDYLKPKALENISFEG